MLTQQDVRAKLSDYADKIRGVEFVSAAARGPDHERDAIFVYVFGFVPEISEALEQAHFEDDSVDLIEIAVKRQAIA